MILNGSAHAQTGVMRTTKKTKKQKHGLCYWKCNSTKCLLSNQVFFFFISNASLELNMCEMCLS